MMFKSKLVCLLFIFLFASFCLTSCQDPPAPDTIVNRFLDSLKNHDYLSAMTYIENQSTFSKDYLPNELPLDSLEGLLTTLINHLTYETPILQEADQQSALVNVVITAPDFQMIVEQYPLITDYLAGLPDSLADDQFLSLLNQGLSDPTIPPKTQTITLSLAYSKRWKIIFDDQLLKQITGGLLDLDAATHNGKLKEDIDETSHSSAIQKNSPTINP